MLSDSASAPVSRTALWTGRIISALVVAFLLMGSTMSLSRSERAVQGLVEMGYPAGSLFGIGVALLISTLLYAIPQTSVLGAILLTGYFGGATATHVRAGEPFFLAVVFGVLVWLALVLRDRRLRELLPLVRTPASRLGER